MAPLSRTVAGRVRDPVAHCNGDFHGALVLKRDSALPYEFFAILTVVQLDARSDRRSDFSRLFTNGWLWGAIVLAVRLQALVIYVPVLRRAFRTVALGNVDWLRCVVVASAVLWLGEAAKFLRRMRGATLQKGERTSPRSRMSLAADRMVAISSRGVEAFVPWKALCKR